MILEISLSIVSISASYKYNWLSFLDSLHVVVEEVAVKTGLEEGGEGLRPAEESLSLIAVDPKE